MWPLMSDNAGAPTSLSAVREHPARLLLGNQPAGWRRTAGRDACAPLPVNRQLLGIFPGGNIQSQRGALKPFRVIQ